jgi:hypothetical protein
MHFLESPVEILFPFVIFLPRLQYGGPSLLMVAPNNATLRLPAGGLQGCLRISIQSLQLAINLFFVPRVEDP